MLSGTPSTMYEMVHEMHNNPDCTLTISEMCSLAGVSRSGYYAWVQTMPARAEREKQDQADFDLILEAYKFRGYDKGSRGIQMRLLHLEQPAPMNRKKIQRLMRKYRLVCPVRGENPYKQMMKALRTNTVAPNILSRQFDSFGPRTVFLTDITYLPYANAFAYLSTILDAYTKQILAYVTSPSLEVDFVLETVKQLFEYHGEEIALTHDAILHSDQGSHYTSHKFIQILQDRALRQSMSRRGNCWDNAPQESFFGHMKDHVKDRIAACTDFKQVSAIVDDYISYYNQDRYQWELAKLSPDEFYQFYVTGQYPLKVEHPPERPVAAHHITELMSGTKDTLPQEDP